MNPTELGSNPQYILKRFVDVSGDQSGWSEKSSVLANRQFVLRQVDCLDGDTSETTSIKSKTDFLLVIIRSFMYTFIVEAQCERSLAVETNGGLEKGLFLVILHGDRLFNLTDV